MKKIIAVVCLSALLAAGARLLPELIAASVPVCETLAPSRREYCETVSGRGELNYADERKITCAFPVVIERMCVSTGDQVRAGDIIALVDRDASAAYIESLGEINMLSVAAADLQAAAALLPDRVVSDCAGKIISVCGNGRAVPSGYSIATAAMSEELSVRTAISELDIARVEIGQPAQFVLSAYPNDVFFGTVSSIAESARSQYSGSVLETVVDVRITPLEFDERFKSGLSAEVEIRLSDPKEIVVLPYSAIEQDDSGEYVYVYENGEAVRRGIFTGAEFPDGTEIRRGLDSGDVVFGNPREVSENRFIRVG